ncbi:unnamed protein product [Leuciscus chuanchicus]
MSPRPTDEEEVVKGMNVGLLVVTEKNTAKLLPKEIIDVAVVLEEEIVLDGLKDVSNAFAVLMGLLYALDITYPKEVKYTFEVLQKVLMKIGGEACSRNKEQTVHPIPKEFGPSRSPRACDQTLYKPEHWDHLIYFSKLRSRVCSNISTQSQIPIYPSPKEEAEDEDIVLYITS